MTWARAQIVVAQLSHIALAWVAFIVCGSAWHADGLNLVFAPKSSDLYLFSFLICCANTHAHVSNYVQRIKWHNWSDGVFRRRQNNISFEAGKKTQKMFGINPKTNWWTSATQLIIETSTRGQMNNPVFFFSTFLHTAAAATIRWTYFGQMQTSSLRRFLCFPVFFFFFSRLIISKTKTKQRSIGRRAAAKFGDIFFGCAFKRSIRRADVGDAVYCFVLYFPQFRLDVASAVILTYVQMLGRESDFCDPTRLVPLQVAGLYANISPNNKSTLNLH